MITGFELAFVGGGAIFALLGVGGATPLALPVPDTGNPGELSASYLSTISEIDVRRAVFARGLALGGGPRDLGSPVGLAAAGALRGVEVRGVEERSID